MFCRQPANDCGLLKIKGSLRYCVVEVRSDTRPRVSLPKKSSYGKYTQVEVRSDTRPRVSLPARGRADSA